MMTEQRALIAEKLLQSGEKERLKEFLKAKLTESGWREEFKAYTKEQVERRGIGSVSVSWLGSTVLPHGHATVPAAVKAEMHAKLRKFLATNCPVAKAAPEKS